MLTICLGESLPSGKIRQRELDGLEPPLIHLAVPMDDYSDDPNQLIDWTGYQKWDVGPWSESRLSTAESQLQI